MCSVFCILYRNRLRLLMVCITISLDGVFLTIPCRILNTFLSQNILYEIVGILEVLILIILLTPYQYIRHCVYTIL